ncbi:POK9 protein, partial [Ploceus nigricollis]|nr:POK9 protein [Ploceus nigricollis]
GSAGVDLVTAESVTVTDDAVTLITTTSNGPLGYGLAALLLGRSSATKQGIFVQPGVIDADYSGPIKIMVRVFAPPLFIPRGSLIAQLIPFTSSVPHTSQPEQERVGGFGSTGPLTAFAQVLSASKPTRTVIIQNNSPFLPPGTTKVIEAEMMLDTGSDITVI